MTELSDEEAFAYLYEKEHGEPPSDEELADYMDQAAEEVEPWNLAFDAECGRPAYDADELFDRLKSQEQPDTVTLQ